MLLCMNKLELIVNKMYDKDAFSKWLGISIIDVQEGYCKLSMNISKDMLNGFGITHGGITYSLADSALAFAANTYGKQCVSIETSISHAVPCKEGDVLTAVTRELSKTDKLGIYLITIINQDDKEVAIFKGTIYRTSKDWDY